MSTPERRTPPGGRGARKAHQGVGDGHTVPQRSPLPATIPRHLPGRLEFFELLWWLIHADALAALDDMTASGWSHADALMAVAEGYRDWLVGNIVNAIDLACETSELAA